MEALNVVRFSNKILDEYNRLIIELLATLKVASSKDDDLVISRQILSITVERSLDKMNQIILKG